MTGSRSLKGSGGVFPAVGRVSGEDTLGGAVLGGFHLDWPQRMPVVKSSPDLWCHFRGRFCLAALLFKDRQVGVEVLNSGWEQGR